MSLIPTETRSRSPSDGSEPAASVREPGGSGRLLAQANVALPRAAWDSPAMSEFVAAVGRVNRAADHSAGFVWRLRSSEAHGTTVDWDGSQGAVVNLSVWESYEALHAFVYRSGHGGFVRRRERWFKPARQPSTVLWWIDPMDLPTVDDAMRRLRFLHAHGPSPSAFTLRRRFEPDGRPTRRARATTET